MNLTSLPEHPLSLDRRMREKGYTHVIVYLMRGIIPNQYAKSEKEAINMAFKSKHPYRIIKL